jgi:hypothetical protein
MAPGESDSLDSHNFSQRIDGLAEFPATGAGDRNWAKLHKMQLSLRHWRSSRHAYCKIGQQCHFSAHYKRKS